MSSRTNYRVPYFQTDEGSYNTLEGTSSVVTDGLGQKIVLKNTLHPESEDPIAPKTPVKPTPFAGLQSASKLWGPSNMVDGLKQILDRKRSN